MLSSNSKPNKDRWFRIKLEKKQGSFGFINHQDKPYPFKSKNRY